MFAAFLATAMSLSVLAQVAPQAASAATFNALKLTVQSARDEALWPDGSPGTPVSKGDPISEYDWIVNEDNTGTTADRNLSPNCTPENPDYGMPGVNPCAWSSIAGLKTNAPIYAQGDESNLNDVDTMNFPDGRYLISVMADGYKLDGLHFEVPRDNQTLAVELQPTPLPTSTVKAMVFADTVSANGQFDPDEDGLGGFVGNIADTLGQVSTDVFGNPLCTRYEPGSGPNGYDWVDGAPVAIPGSGGNCFSLSLGTATQAANNPNRYTTDPAQVGVLTIPNLGTNRYALSVVPPDGQNWVQTTTLEGNHDWDAWLMEGSTGLDTEFTVAGEPFPAIIFGYVPGPTSTMNGYAGTPAAGYHPASSASTSYCIQSACWRLPSPTLPNGTGKITGVVDAVKVYVPAAGGLPNGGQVWGGLNGGKIDQPIKKPWIVLNDLTRGDRAVWIGQGDSQGRFTIPRLPAGDYLLTYWDEAQDYILDITNVTVGNGETVDLGVTPLTGWWTVYEGYVFNDTNRNGVRDPGEAGVPNYGLTLRRRDNSLMDRGTTGVTTDQSGYYRFESAYPLTQWIVLEAYNDVWYTTGVTFQADNQDQPTTVQGAGVDVSVLPIIGLGGRIDWGVHSYDGNGTTNGLDPRNGGIVGTVSYDTTRNELDPAFAAVEDWQPGVPDLTVNLYEPVACGTNAGAPCDANGDYELNADGSFEQGTLLNQYITETWERPTGCVARDVNGDPLKYPDSQQVLPYDPGNAATGFQNQDADCLEGPLSGVQFQTGFSSVDGNYGFGTICPNGATGPETCASGDPEDIPAGDYLVDVDVPDNPGQAGDPMYKFTREEDINIGNGDAVVPQAPPPACVGALHTVDNADFGDQDGYPAVDLPDPSGNGGDPVHVDASTPTVNPTFVNDVGGSPYEGEQKPLCDTKLVTLNNGRSIVPTFNVFTDVPIPGRFFGYMIDDLNFSSDPKSLLYGEKKGVPFAPVGIYDYADRLITTATTDYNGVYDVLLPSTNRINCPTPSGVCSNVYRFVGNDPGTIGHLNPNYSPRFHTIAAEFEATPGIVIPADNAPTQVGVSVQIPGSQQNAWITCPINDPDTAPTTPELLAVSKPYADLRSASSDSFTIDGQGFGGSPGTVALDGVALPTGTWNDTHIAATVPNTIAGGVHQLTISATNGRTTVNGLTFHVLTADVSTANAFASTGVLANFNGGSLSNFNNSGTGITGVNNTGTANDYAQIRTGTGVSGNLMRTTGYNTNQEAFVTLRQISSTATQGLLLKYSGGSNPSSTGARWIQVAYSPAAGGVVVNSKNATATISPVGATIPSTFTNGDRLGARVLANGTIEVYKSIGTGVWTPLGTRSFSTAGTWTGQIGLRYTSTGTTSTTEARADDFGGGNVVFTTVPGYHPNLYEVGPQNHVPAGHYTPRYDPGTWSQANPSHAIQNAIDDALGNNAQDLVIVYPGVQQDARINPLGGYYENLIVNGPIKLQGVGPGGLDNAGHYVQGSIIDGTGFNGDTTLFTDWQDKVGGMTWVGNQTVVEGQDIYLLSPSNNAYGPDGAAPAGLFKASIDGFQLRGGDQSGFPGNINEIGGGPTGLPPAVAAQGGAIMANSNVRNLQITNNVVTNNSGAFGTIRVGTADIGDQQNDNVRIANNRIVANAGTNLAGGVGIFSGTDNYQITKNDICGNFSAEYGGGVSVFGRSNNGSIDHNRIYYNQSYDEGGGIMIAGELPTTPTALSPGSGAVTIDSNLIQGNLGNDDGGGIRFLMAGNFPMNVTNNMVVNNVSTHEGGGIAINDAPNVRVVNNTIMKNITTATAVTSNGSPAPAGLSTSRNSVPLQNTLRGGSANCGSGTNAPCFSNPLLFNNVFWDNRAGTRAGGTVTGIGSPGDASAINRWDLGVPDNAFMLSPTNSLLQQTSGYNASGTNVVGSDPQVVSFYDTTLTFQPWRTNPAFVGAILVAQDLPVTLFTGDYHLTTGSPARNMGAANKAFLPPTGTTNTTLNAPALDIDGQARPADGAFDMSADEVGAGVAAFPRTGVLDTFDRANGPLGANWGSLTAGSFNITGNAVDATATGDTWWGPSSPKFGPNQEAYLTFGQISNTATDQGLLLKFNGTNPNGSGSSWIGVFYDGTGNLAIKTKVGTSVVTQGAAIPVTFVAGQTLGVRAQSDGTITIYKIDGGTLTTVATRNVATNASTNGRIGTRVIGATAGAGAMRFDNFGGGTMP